MLEMDLTLSGATRADLRVTLVNKEKAKLDADTVSGS